MSNFFSSPWFLEASAAILFPGMRARPQTIRVGSQLFDTLLLPDGTVAANPLMDFLEPRPLGIPALGEVMQVRSLPRVAMVRAEVTRPPSHPPGLVPAPCIDWRGFSSWDDFVTQTSKREWRAFKETRRKRRKLTRLFGPVRLDVDLPDHGLVEQALLQKARQLRRTKGLDHFVSRRTRQLVHLLVEQGHLTLSVLSAGGRPLAFALAHWGAQRLSCWITSYDPDAADCSPGTLLLEGMMEESRARGQAEFDFLIGGETYKYHYATHERLVGPLGQVPLRQRLMGTIRRALEEEGRTQRVQQVAHDVALHTLQFRLSRQSWAPIHDAPYRNHIEAHIPEWPRIRFLDPQDCQLVRLMAHHSTSAGTVASAGAWTQRHLRLVRSFAKDGARQLVHFPSAAAQPTAPARPLNLAPGDLVRVKAPDEIPDTLVDGDESGVSYRPSSMARHGGQTFQVQRRIGAFNDARTQRVLRPESAVVLQGVVCDGAPAAHVQGCDRQCAMVWNEAWLERVEDEKAQAQHDKTSGLSADSPPGDPRRLMRVRSQAAIEQEEQERPDPSGVKFTAATMAAFCGGTFRVRAPVARVYDPRCDGIIPLQDTFLLEGVDCTGAPLLAAGNCDTRCALLWRGAWLEPVET